MMRSHKVSPVAVLVLALTLASCGEDNPAKPSADGTTPPAAPEQVTPFGARHPDLSPDGTRLVMELGIPPGIVTLPTGGGAIDTLGLGYAVGPDWSPDGSRVAVDGGGAIVLIEAASKDVSILGSGDVDGPPDWSPDGSKIAARTTSSGDGIGITTYPAGDWSILPCEDQNGSSCDGEDPTWAPDGSAIAFEDGLEILRVPSGGGTASVVASGFDDVTEPSWSPDGKWIAFVAESTGTSDYYTHIWVADSRGMQYGLKQATFGAAEDGDPAWSRDTGTIYFTSNRGGGSAIWRVAFRP